MLIWFDCIECQWKNKMRKNRSIKKSRCFRRNTWSDLLYEMTKTNKKIGKWVKSKTKFDGIKEMQCRAETRRDQLTQTSWNEMLTGSGQEWFNTNWKFWSDSNYWSYRSHNPHCSSTVPTQVFFNQGIKTICPFTQTWNKLQHRTFWK